MAVLIGKVLFNISALLVYWPHTKMSPCHIDVFFWTSNSPNTHCGSQGETLII